MGAVPRRLTRVITRVRPSRALSPRVAGSSGWLGWALALPAMLLIALGMLVPLGWLFYTSLREWLGFGQTSTALTLHQYEAVFTDSLYRNAILHALGLGGVTALFCVFASYPVAYYLTFRAGRHRNLLLLVILSSLFSSYLARVYAWRTILGTNGVINKAVQSLGLSDHPLELLLFNNFAVVMTWANVFLPLTILLLTASMANIDEALLQSARDLGANALRAVARVVLPLTLPAAVSSFLYVLVLASGDYVTPILVGGKSGLMVGQVITDQFLTIGDQPQGAALAFVMLGIFAVLYLVLAPLTRLKLKSL